MISYISPFNFSTLFKRLSLISLGFSLFTLPTLSNAANANTETQLTGVLIHKIATYLNWNKKSNKELTYCFVGNNSHTVGDFLTSQKNIGRLPYHITLRNFTNLVDSSNAICDLLYVDKSTNWDRQVFNQLAKSTFTITNDKELLAKGFVVSIELDQNKPQLTLSKSNLQKTNIVIDARFLSVVNVVE